MKYCIDTNIIVELFRENDLVIKKLESLEDLAITTLTLCELYKGAFLAQNTEKQLRLIGQLLERVAVLGLDEKACYLYGKIYASLKKEGKLTQDVDLIMASISIKNDLKFLTDNIRHFKNIPNLKIETIL